ncbi:GxxExxY protein [Chitinophaga silvatica]|uniref:GxxExxY protein n=1 Tax=Chitinophaga silvatica TaxID=2282649 RepID=A0A3E1YDG3_9BACT|nr:GxxExxY protein [Chitinophaga silvatica]RFS24514.1 GxxExxY protein [Chitinophaga silvatica]
MTENEISKEIVDVCFKIHQKFGPGLYESVYEELIDYELKKRNLICERQLEVKLIHENLIFEKAFRTDLLINKKVLIEVKSVEELKNLHYKQVLTYLKLMELKLGLLVNFNVPLIKLGIHRIVNNL